MTFKPLKLSAGPLNKTTVSATYIEHPWLQRGAFALAACTALLFISGPAVSSNDARPLYSLGQTHIWLGAAVTILTAVVAFWLRYLKEREWLPDSFGNTGHKRVLRHDAHKGQKDDSVFEVKLDLVAHRETYISKPNAKRPRTSRPVRGSRHKCDSVEGTDIAFRMPPAQCRPMRSR